MKIRDIMTTKVEACRLDTDLAAVARTMWDHDCGFVPVVDAAGAVVGVITDRDICIASATRRLTPEHISAEQVMSRGVHACLPEDAVGDVLATMKKCQVRRLPVIDEHGLLKGVVSMNDIVLASHRAKGPAAKDVVGALASICAHRTVTPVAA